MIDSVTVVSGHAVSFARVLHTVCRVIALLLLFNLIKTSLNPHSFLDLKMTRAVLFSLLHIRQEWFVKKQTVDIATNADPESTFIY